MPCWTSNNEQSGISGVYRFLAGSTPLLDPCQGLVCLVDLGFGGAAQLHAARMTRDGGPKRGIVEVGVASGGWGGVEYLGFIT